jgi:hypothetical protein
MPRPFRAQSIHSALPWGTTIIQPDPKGSARSTGTGQPQPSGYHAPVTPFNVFLNTRGSQFKTPGWAFATPPSGGPRAGWWCSAIPPTPPPSGHSARRSCSPWGATSPKRPSPYRAQWHCPGNSQRLQGSVLNVDQPDGRRLSRPARSSTRIDYFDKTGRCYSAVPLQPHRAMSLSFFGIKFDDARIASVRITAGNVARGE